MSRYQNLNLKQVQTLAQELAGELQDKNVVLGLTGNLGAGKTAFAKAFAKALGVTRAASPTFVIMHEHEIPNNHLFHIDLYRLESPKELVGLGLDEILNTNPRLILIEWVDKFPKLLKACNLIINFKIKPNNLRDVTIKTA